MGVILGRGLAVTILKSDVPANRSILASREAAATPARVARDVINRSQTVTVGSLA